MASKKGAQIRRKMEDAPRPAPHEREYFKRLNAKVGWGTTSTSTTTTTTTTTS